MEKVGIRVDYSDICKDYNTGFLDRDNLDPATKKCMKQVLSWSKDFLTDLLEAFDAKLHNVSSDTPVKVLDVSAKRFLFYSLEKEIMLQSYVVSSDYEEYGSLSAWGQADNDSILIKNDEDGGAISFYFNPSSDVSEWIKTKLEGFTLDDLVFDEK